MKKTYIKETTIALFSNDDLPKGLDYKLIFDEIESNRDYAYSVDFYYHEDGTVCFLKIVDTKAFLETIKLDFKTKTYKLLKVFLAQKSFAKSNIVFYNYR